MASDTFYCASCGKEHAGLPTDWAFRLPDEIHALSYMDRYLRSRHNADLCTLDGSRFFVRGVVLIPFTDAPGEFAWGMWVEVTREAHDLYVNGFDQDMSAQPRMAGRLANDIPAYPPTLGVAVDVQFQDAGSRPLLWFAASVSHALAHEQRGGISTRRQHDILSALGFFDEEVGA